jgi:hypothetical protein
VRVVAFERLPREIRIPHTCTGRHQLTYAVLIRRVFPQREFGDAFEGKRFRPGSMIVECSLWPDAGYPAEPLLVEYAGSDRSGSGHRRSSHTYLLWRLDPVRFEWVEIARAAAVGIEWVDPLKSVALRHRERERIKRRKQRWATIARNDDGARIAENGGVSWGV